MRKLRMEMLEDRVLLNSDPLTLASPSLPVRDLNAMSIAALVAGAPAAAVPLSGIPILHSNPAALQKLYLDFDGQTVTDTIWNSSYGIEVIHAVPYDTDGNLNSFSDAEQTAIKAIWERVSEDYRPFNIDVTTEEPSLVDLHTGARVQRVLISTDRDDTRLGGDGSQWIGGTYGGIAYYNTWSDSSETTAWVYYNNLGGGAVKYTAEAISHEAGHTFGLGHDGQTPSTEYYQGQGSGEVGWAPIMGAAYYENVTQWSKGEYTGANNTQDDLAIIASTTNHVVYRTDDVGNDAAAATQLIAASNHVWGGGIITSNTDWDVFSFTTGAGGLSFSVAPLGSGVGNLDAYAEIRDASNNILGQTDHNQATLATTVTAVAPAAGTYYLWVRGDGWGDPLSTGYTNYGSLGQYAVSGTVVDATADTPAPIAALSVGDITVGGGRWQSFTVSFTDNVAVNASTLDNADVLVMGPGGFSQFAKLAGVDVTANGRVRTATYYVSAPDQTGSGAYWWTSTANGSYSISLQAGQVADTSGNMTAAGLLGSFTVNIAADVTAPTASLAVSNASAQSGATDYQFTVAYSDDSAMCLRTLDMSDLTVTGPNGFNRAARLVSISSWSDGPVRTATYGFVPPGGTWDTADMGTYTITLSAGQVFDTNHNSVASGVLGTFHVYSDTTSSPGTITARGADSGYGAANAIDNSTTTKWRDSSPDANRASWIQYQYADGTMYTVANYTLTSADKVSNRYPGAADPYSWKLLGSNDGGQTWVTLDTRTAVTFSARYQTQSFSVAAPGTYTLYRLQIDSVASLSNASYVQMAEWELLALSNNHSPVAANDTATIKEDTAVQIDVLANDSDVDGDALTISGTGTPAHGTTTIESNQIRYSPSADYNGLDSFTYTISDGSGGTATATVNITVTSVNDAPQGTSKTVTTLEDTPYTFTVVDFGFSDAHDAPSNALLAVMVTTLPAAGNLKDNGVALAAGQFVSAADISAGKLAFTPAADAVGTGYASFTFQVQDNGGTANGGVDIDPTPQSLTVTVLPVNDSAPVITSPSVASVAENTLAVLTVTTTDADLPPDTLSYSINGGPDAARFTIDAGSGVLSFGIPPDYENPADVGGDNVYNVTVQVFDGLHAVTQTVAVTVAPVNDNAPVITSSSVASVAENTSAVLTVMVTDADLPPDTLTYSINGGVDAATFSIDASTGVLAFVSAPDYEAPVDSSGDNVYNVTVQVFDGLHAVTQAVAMTVTPVNETPTDLAISASTVAENRPTGTAVGTLSTTDADTGDTFTYTLVTGTGSADNASFSISGDILQTAAVFNYEAKSSYDIRIRTTDQGGLWYEKPYVISIADLPEVAGRSIFYNNSAWDGNNPLAGTSDDAAIATDKSALLPGQTASFANYTSYSRGINGIMIDIAGLPAASLTATDFTFKVGNSSTPSSWLAAAAPSSITVREGAGIGGSDRVTILWADNAIQKQWLEITVKANANTGLASHDVFYFGNAMGDSGNSTADTIVDGTDLNLARNNQHSTFNKAAITDAFDFNRDRLVDGTDFAIVRNNQTSSFSALRLIKPPALFGASQPLSGDSGIAASPLLAAATSVPNTSVSALTTTTAAATDAVVSGLTAESAAYVEWLYDVDSLTDRTTTKKREVATSDQTVNAALVVYGV